MSLMGRLFNDYLLPGRWDAYRSFLETALKHGYTFTCHRDALEALAGGRPRLLFLRHDIDTDVPITRQLFAIEQELGIRSTYYFRRRTADPELMRRIHASGSEVGYHFEEIADWTKAHRARTREAVLPHLDEIRDTFLRNLRGFEEILGAKVRTVAGHGDFANRRISLANPVLMDDRVRREGGIEMEAYDAALMERLTFRATDQMYPGLWQPASPEDAVREGTAVALVLIHPRHWKRAPLHRLHLDLDRLLEGIRFELPERR
jgi:hypothetical protein